MACGRIRRLVLSSDSNEGVVIVGDTLKYKGVPEWCEGVSGISGCRR